MSTKIETDRLIMRPVEVAEAPLFVETCGEYDIVKMTATWPWPLSLELTKERFRNAQGSDHSKRIMVSILYQGEFIGTAGLSLIEETNVARLGYMIGRPWWGKGLMTEAVEGLCRYGFETMQAATVEADHYHDNPASGRVLEKVGFIKTGASDNTFSAARQEDVPCWAYRLTPEGFAK